MCSEVRENIHIFYFYLFERNGITIVSFYLIYILAIENTQKRRRLFSSLLDAFLKCDSQLSSIHCFSRSNVPLNIWFEIMNCTLSKHFSFTIDMIFCHWKVLAGHCKKERELIFLDAKCYFCSLCSCYIERHQCVCQWSGWKGIPPNCKSFSDLASLTLPLITTCHGPPYADIEWSKTCACRAWTASVCLHTSLSLTMTHRVASLGLPNAD